MFLWMLIAVLWILATVFEHQHMQTAVFCFGAPAAFLTWFALLRAVVRWLGRQFRGDYKRG